MPPYKPLSKKEEATLAAQGQAKRGEVTVTAPTTLRKAMQQAVPAVKKAVKAAVEKAAKGAAKFTLPKTLAGVVDALYNVREERLAHDRESTVLKKDEAQLREHLIAKLSKGEESGVQGQVAFAYVDNGTAFTVKDWDKFYAAIVKEYSAAKTPGAKAAAFRYLNRAVSKEPMQEKWDNGETFPGVERIPIKKVNVSKRRGNK
jgi:hypothetical protein